MRNGLVKNTALILIVAMTLTITGCSNEQASESTQESSTDNKTEIQEIEPVEPETVPAYDPGYARYANEEMIPEAMGLLQKVPELLKEKGVVGAKKIDVHFYAGYIELYIYDGDDKGIARAEYRPDNDDIEVTIYGQEESGYTVLDSSGNVYISCDGRTNTIYEYDPEGRVKTERILYVDVDGYSLTEDMAKSIDYYEIYDSEYESSGEYASEEGVLDGLSRYAEDVIEDYYTYDYERITYEYDKTGNIVDEKCYSNENDDSLTYRQHHEYDDNGNLIRESSYDEENKETYSQEYTYESGKIQSIKSGGLRGGGLEKYEYNESGDLVSKTYFDSDDVKTSQSRFYYSDDNRITLELHHNLSEEKFGDASLSGEISL